MKLGFGLYKHMLNPAYFAFARQVGATHVVVHLVDYFNKGGAANPRQDQPVGELPGWGYAGDINVLRIFRILKKNNFAGMIIPDHAPQLACDAPWHSGMAFAMGYSRACLKAVEV
jgi:sugar phosphate isomerase/epimerase